MLSYGYFDLQLEENEKKELRFKITYFRKEFSMIGGPIYDFHEYLLFYPAAARRFSKVSILAPTYITFLRHLCAYYVYYIQWYIHTYLSYITRRKINSAFKCLLNVNENQGTTYHNLFKKRNWKCHFLTVFAVKYTVFFPRYMTYVGKVSK